MAKLLCVLLCVCVIFQLGKTCNTKDGDRGNCISIYNCPTYVDMIQRMYKQESNREMVIQTLQKAHCGFENEHPKVCCPLPAASSPVTRVDSSAHDLVPSLPDPPVCGAVNASFNRVVDGINATLGEFPWMAVLGYKVYGGLTRWLCGGSLISSRHILTAAHCIHNHENQLYVVRLGELDLARADDGASPVDVMIKRKIKHERYSATTFTNDIGILVLNEDVQFTDLIKPICIPKDSALRAMSFENYNPFLAGWGSIAFGGPSATHLQVLQLPVVSNEFCSQAYAGYKDISIDERVLCAGYRRGGKDACQGDSGGPLMLTILSRSDYKIHFYQIGVISYGMKCAEAGFPGVYSRITHFVPWIEQQVTGHSS